MLRDDLIKNKRLMDRKTAILVGKSLTQAEFNARFDGSSGYRGWQAGYGIKIIQEKSTGLYGHCTVTEGQPVASIHPQLILREKIYGDFYLESEK